jgi:transcriptional regulator with XRE-family HTH domain
MQSQLRGALHPAYMPQPLNTIAQRVAWAIAESGRTKTDIAKQIGCTHAALSQWASGRVDIGNSRVNLLRAFCAAVHVRVDWLLTGEGAARDSYPEASALVVIARDIAARDGDLADTAERILRALVDAKPPQ